MIKITDHIIEKYTNERIAGTLSQIALLQEEIVELEKNKKRAQEVGGIEAWLHYRFESSTRATPEFNTFTRAFRRHLQKLLGDGFEITSWSKGHFDVSAFIRNKATDKLAYLSISDVRHFPDSWYESILVRTAQSTKDYTGGSNHYARLLDIKGAVEMLTG